MRQQSECRTDPYLEMQYDFDSLAEGKARAACDEGHVVGGLQKAAAGEGWPASGREQSSRDGLCVSLPCLWLS